MEYKKCEHCGEEIHIRSQKCPFCNQTVAEVVPEEVKEESVSTEEIPMESENNEVVEEINEHREEVPNEQNAMNMPPHINFEIGRDGKPRDYVYKAEVRHSLEYTNPLSNMAKVFISALCTLPILGQMIGIFIGVFFSTYEDLDRKSFGRALMFLSAFMFFMYLAYVKYAMTLLEHVDVNALMGK